MCIRDSSPRDIALLGRHSESAPPNQPPVPPDVNWCCTTGTFSEQRRTILGAWIRLRPSRRIAQPLQHYGAFQGSPFLVQGRRRFWWLGKMSASMITKGVYLVRFLDDPGPIKLPLPPARHTTSTGAVRGSWCLQVNLAGAFARGVQRNVDESRGAAVDN